MIDIPHIFKIQRYSLHDGPGIRTTLFFQGCPLSCIWCHNPESQPKLCQQELNNFTQTALLLISEIEKDRVFYDESCGGVTFSGGEPLFQPDLLYELLDLCKRNEIHTCLDTSGFAPFDILEKAAQKTDMLLYDIKLMDEDAHKQFTGQSVALVLENLKQLSRQDINLTLRFPLIPGITDKADNIEKIVTFLIKETRFRDIQILPFHKTGFAKYENLKVENRMQHIDPPSKGQIQIIKSKFDAKGFKTVIGG
ncbi:MAG: glycyl-radical enzyme activating protein [Desulfobacteraceae bacterium]|nr:glycyl-radical enzyme activating protein [Desulfobacteraceae bacterium]